MSDKGIRVIFRRWRDTGTLIALFPRTARRLRGLVLRRIRARRAARRSRLPRRHSGNPARQRRRSGTPGRRTGTNRLRLAAHQTGFGSSPRSPSDDGPEPELEQFYPRLLGTHPRHLRPERGTTRIGTLEVEEAAKKAAGNWRKFESFLWFRELDRPEDWAIFYSHTRDSGLMEQSNAHPINPSHHLRRLIITPHAIFTRP